MKVRHVPCVWRRQVRETSERLDRFHVVQPFAWLVRLPPETRWINPADIDVSLKWEEGGLVPFRQIYFSAGFMTGCRGLHQMVYHVINDENDHELGHVGIAWAAQVRAACPRAVLTIVESACRSWQSLAAI